MSGAVSDERASRSIGARATWGSPPRPASARLGPLGHVRRPRRGAGRAPSPKGEVPILEEGLPALVAEGLARRAPPLRGRRRRRARADAEFVFLCVQTPQSRDRRRRPLGGRGGRRARSRRCCAPGAVVVNKSTMPVGSTRLVARELSRGRGRPTTSAWRRTPSSSARATRCATSSQPSRVVIGCDDTAVAVRGLRALPRACRRRSSSPTRRRPR